MYALRGDPGFTRIIATAVEPISAEVTAVVAGVLATPKRREGGSPASRDARFFAADTAASTARRPLQLSA